MGTELTYQERLIRFEVAQDTIGLLMAHCTHCIHEEQKKDAPDAGKIAEWQAEFDRLFDEQYELRPGDNTEIARVLADYGPLVRARYEMASSGD
ncbi:hypothetical protein ACSV9I_07465 [Rhizobium sp. G187]|uniref:hypothetical protein n=1 Tax=Rhizobium sp. G187 TaxID=3451352 RepID=UPI003EE4B31B